MADYIRSDPSVRKVLVYGEDPSGALVSANPTSKDIEGGGKVTVGTTAVEVTFVVTITSVLISADKDNTGTLYIGKSTVTSTGSNAVTYLEAGDTITIDYDDAINALYVVGSAADQNFWKGATL